MDATTPQIDYDTRRFKTSEVAAAAGIPAGTLRSYFFHKKWRQIGRPAESEGLPHSFNLRDALTYALAAKLMSVGVKAKAAFDIAALDFVHSSDDANRDPSELFDVHEHGMTILVYWPGSHCAKVVAEEDVGSLADLSISGRVSGYEEETILLVLNYLEKRVFTALGI